MTSRWRDRAARAEQWLRIIQQEIEEKLLAPKSSSDAEQKSLPYQTAPDLCQISPHNDPEHRINQHLEDGGNKGTDHEETSALLAAAVLLVSSGIASAQSQTPMTKDRAPATSGQSAPQSDPPGAPA